MTLAYRLLRVFAPAMGTEGSYLRHRVGLSGQLETAVNILSLVTHHIDQRTHLDGRGLLI